MAGAASDIAWAAGLFEGEGCLSFGHRTLHATLAMTDVDVVDRFQSIVGFGQRRERVDGHRSDPRGYKHEWKTAYVWDASSFEHVQALIAMFWPFFGERRRARARNLMQSKRVDRLQAYRNRGQVPYEKEV